MLGSDSIRHCEKIILMNTCLILNGYCDRAVSICSISKPNAIRFMFVGLDEEQSLQKRGGYLIQIAVSHYGCCCLHKEM